MQNKFYITTPIYYPSADAHIGHAYSSLVCDAIARYKKQMGYDVFLATGTDEHGQKIEQSAENAGVSPKEFVDKIVSNFKNLWEALGIEYNQFIRTTDDYHKQTVQAIFQKLYDKGDIYKGEYEGWYCTPCESFLTDTQLVNGNCPDCGRAVSKTSEECYFFKLGKYADKIIEHIENNPNFILPKSRANEMLNNFLKKGLEDLCVSRSTFTWGVKVPFDSTHVIYVWIDALPNYISGLGILNDTHKNQDFWPCDLHVIGKEITRFHTIIWPALLMALDLPLPKSVYAHGWWTVEGEKMSKSVGNVINPVDYAEKYGVDATRYCLLRGMGYGTDADWSHAGFVTRYNSDLANDLGNLFSRTSAMILKYFGEEIKEISPNNALKTDIDTACSEYQAQMDVYSLASAIDKVLGLVSRANKYIDETQPWILGKDETKSDELKCVLYNLCLVLKNSAKMLLSIIPQSAQKILDSINITENSVSVQKTDVLFPRIDAKTDVAPNSEQAK